MGSGQVSESAARQRFGGRLRWDAGVWRVCPPPLSPHKKTRISGRLVFVVSRVVSISSVHSVWVLQSWLVLALFLSYSDE